MRLNTADATLYIIILGQNNWFNVRKIGVKKKKKPACSKELNISSYFYAIIEMKLAKWMKEIEIVCNGNNNNKEYIEESLTCLCFSQEKN